jgi:hypothetical protein
MYGWWFVCIALGFLLLGLRSILAGGHPWMAVLRFVIAAGFLASGVGFLKAPSTKQQRGKKRPIAAASYSRTDKRKFALMNARTTR